MMAGQIRLFEKDADGLLHQVAPAEAEARRAGRAVSSVQLVIEVLWTDEEQAEHAARQALELQRLANQAKMREENEVFARLQAVDRETLRLKVVEKLKTLGLDDDEIGVLL